MQDIQPVNAFGELNLDSRKILNWADLFKARTDNLDSANQVTPTVGTTTLKPTVAPAPEKSVSVSASSAATEDPLVGLISMDPIDKVIACANDSGPRTDPSIPSLQDIVAVSYDGACCEEIEIDDSFNGTITMQKAKYDIFRDCLGFKDFKNFVGVRFSYKGIRKVNFKLEYQINDKTYSFKCLNDT